MNHGGQDRLISQSHNVNYNHTTASNTDVYSLQDNPGDDDNSNLTPNSSNNISGDFHGLILYSCWVCGTGGHLSQYCSKAIGRGRYAPD